MSVLSVDGQQRLEDVLLKVNMISASKLADAKVAAQKANKPLVTYLVENKLITDEQLTKANATISKVPYVNLTSAKIDPNVLGLLPQDIAQRYMAVPLGEMQHRLVVAMLDADNVQAVDFLSNRIGRPLKVYAASESGILQVLRQYEARLDTQMGAAFGNIDKAAAKETEAAAKETEKQPVSKEIKDLVEDSPISKALTAVLEFAGRNRASDIHIEPLEKEVKIRCRIDGILREIMRLPKSTEPALVSRIKILANLKIDEHRIPQDGQFSFTLNGKQIDLRIAIAPIVWGEQIVIRLLDKSGTSLMLEDMGYTGRALRTIRKVYLTPTA
jgi:type IV pilus assembly protein PilB